MAHEILKNFIKHQKEAGRSSISIDELETMLASEDEVLPIELKKLDLAHQRKILMMQMAEASIQQSSLENFKAVISMGQNALKSILMINGGATVAFIAFLNNNLGKFLQSGDLSKFFTPLWLALVMFGVGTVMASLGIALSYLAQGDYLADYEKTIVPKVRNWSENGGRLTIEHSMSKWHIASLVVCIIAYTCALGGIISCAWGFSSFL